MIDNEFAGDDARIKISQFCSIIENNPDFVVVCKNPDINFHCEEGEIGLVVALEKHLAIKLYSVHRLDKMTSGLVILAKSSQVAHALSTLFLNQQIEKYYLAISDKKPKKKQGLIKGGMAKSRRGMWKLTKQKNNLAITQFFSFSLGKGKRLFVIKPHTGKTHQIRVALKSIGSAICGDPLYEDKSLAQATYDRGYLHAFKIKFSLYQQYFCFTCLPDAGELFIHHDFLKALQDIGEVGELPWPKV